MTEASSSLKKPAGIPASITWTWEFAGEFDAGTLTRGRTYEPCVALMLKGGNRDGWTSPVVLALQLPDGRQPSPPPVTVDPQCIPLNSYVDFSFPTFVAAGAGAVKLSATTTQKGNLGSALLVANEKAKIKRTNYNNIPLDITWTWSLSGVLGSEKLEKGSAYGLALPLKLTGDSYDGWLNPLSLRLQLPDGEVVPPNTLSPNLLPLGQYRDFQFPEFVNPGWSGKKLLFTADSTQKGNLPSTLVVADAEAKIMRTYGHVDVGINWTWTAAGVIDIEDLVKGTEYEAVLLLTLQGTSRDGWKNPVTLQVVLPDGAGQSPPPATVDPSQIPLGVSADISFPKFTVAGGSGVVKLVAKTSQDANLFSALVVDGGNAKLNQILIPLSVRRTWKLTGELDCTDLAKGVSYTVQLPLEIDGDRSSRWMDPLGLTLHLPDGNNPPPNIIYPSKIPLGAFQDFPFPAFVNQGDGKVLLSATTMQDGNLPSYLVVADGQAKYQQIYGNTRPVSITSTWTATGEFDIRTLSIGSTYAVALPLTLNGTSYDGWKNPVVLQLEILPGGEPQTTTVDPKEIPLQGAYKQFFFPDFVAQESGTARLSVRTTQEGNLPSTLLVEKESALINETDTAVPLSITWTWNARGEVDGAGLREGSTYDVALPLTLNGESRDGWRKPLTLEIQLPEGKSPPPITVYPPSVSLGTYQDVSFPRFVAQVPGKILLSATTTQDSNLFSSLLIEDQKANIKEF